MSKIVRYTRDNLPAIGERVHSFWYNSCYFKG